MTFFALFLMLRGISISMHVFVSNGKKNLSVLKCRDYNSYDVKVVLQRGAQILFYTSDLPDDHLPSSRNRDSEVK